VKQCFQFVQRNTVFVHSFVTLFHSSELAGSLGEDQHWLVCLGERRLRSQPPLAPAQPYHIEGRQQRGGLAIAVVAAGLCPEEGTQHERQPLRAVPALEVPHTDIWANGQGQKEPSTRTSHGSSEAHSLQVGIRAISSPYLPRPE